MRPGKMSAIKNAGTILLTGPRKVALAAALVSFNAVRIGIDEVGRGCLAGPVTVSAAFVPAGFKEPAGLPELRDSKLMTRLQREAWYDWVKNEGLSRGIAIAISSVSPRVVDRINISMAANLAAWRSVNKLLCFQNGIGADLSRSKFAKAEIILDGSLYLKSRTFQKRGDFPSGPLCARTVTGADRKFKEVKLAAIVAKVTRDAYMRRMAEKYPGYGFEAHKGYGTRAHLEAIRREGIIEGFHRKTFLGNSFLV